MLGNSLRTSCPTKLLRTEAPTTNDVGNFVRQSKFSHVIKSASYLRQCPLAWHIFDGYTERKKPWQRQRRTQRALPLAQSESYSYDAAGNVLTLTDLNNKTTTYTYGQAKRLLRKKPDASSASDFFSSCPYIFLF